MNPEQIKDVLNQLIKERDELKKANLNYERALRDISQCDKGIIHIADATKRANEALRGDTE